MPREDDRFPFYNSTQQVDFRVMNLRVASALDPP